MQILTLQLLKTTPPPETKLILGHSIDCFNGLFDNQPVVRDGLISSFHNGIVVNELEIWSDVEIDRQFEIDSEVIIAAALKHLRDKSDLFKL